MRYRYAEGEPQDDDSLKMPYSLALFEVVPVAGLEPARRFRAACLSLSLVFLTFKTLLTRAGVMRYRYAAYGKHPQATGQAELVLRFLRS